MQKSLTWALIVSETSHVLCCVLPTVFSLLSLLAGMGMVVMPGFMVEMHDFIHHWELPIIGFSGIVLLMGWAVYWYGEKVQCRHDAGCGHESCAPKKGKTHLILVAATVLFTFNLAIYLFVHRSDFIENKLESTHSGHEQEAR